MQVLELFDTFGKNPSLIVKSKTEHKTGFGGFVTILLMVVSLVAAIFFGQELINKQAPSVNLSTESYPNPEILPYEDNFEFMIGVQNRKMKVEINPKIYFLRAFLFSTTINSTGIFNDRFDIDLVPCSSETLSRENYNAVKHYDLKNYYCVSKKQKFSPEELYIKEFFGHNGFRMMQVKIYECRNTTTSQECDTQEAIEYSLNLTIISIVSIDNYVQTMDYKKPFTKGIKEGFFYVSQNFFLSMTQYIHHMKMHSDDGLLFSTDKVQGGFKLEEMVDYYIYQRDSDNFVSFSIQLSNIMDGYYRKYYKLQDFAAQIGGIYKTICMVLFLVMMLYEETSYYQYLINLFFYLSTDKKDGSQKLDDNTMDRINSGKPNLKVLNNPISIKTTSMTKQSKPPHKKKIIKLSFFDRLFCLSLIPPRCRKKKKVIDTLYFKGKKTLNDTLEVSQVVKSLYDINMLKKFILSEEQQNKFEAIFLPVLTNMNNNQLSSNQTVTGPLYLKEKGTNNFIKPLDVLEKFKEGMTHEKSKDTKSQSKNNML